MSKSEIETVAKKIHEISENDNTLLYTLIHILGQANAIQYKDLIEKFIDYPTDPLVAKISLKCLCNYWDMTKEYLNELKMFIKGVDWDLDEDVRLVAISTAGEFLKANPNNELLGLLVEVFENILDSDLLKPAHDPALIQASAYTAISRALGKEYHELPGVSETLKKFELGKLDLSIIEQAKRRLLLT